MGHFEQGGVKLAIAASLELLAGTTSLPVAIGLTAVSAVVGSVGVVETFIGLGEMQDPDNELRDIDF